MTLDIVGVAVFAVTGDLDRAVLAAVAWRCPAWPSAPGRDRACAGTSTPARFRRLVLGLLAVAGISAVVSALT